MAKTNKRRTELERYCQAFYAHNKAAEWAARRLENDTLQENCDEHQHRHASFEQSLNSCLSVSTAYYTVSDPSKQPQEGDTVDNTLIEEFDFSDIQADHYFNDNSEEPITRKRTAGFIRLEGRGRHTQDSCFCGSDEPSLYRCKDCHGVELVCHQCVLYIHQWQRCHCIKHWNRSFFQKTSLKSLGLCIQLGHHIVNDFVIIDVNGVHAIGLDFCGCQTAQVHVTQLLQVHLFPATTVKPKTAATFRALEHFQILSFESKVSAFEFYQMVDHYEAFLRMIREWRFLKQVKQSGQGHHPGSIAAMEPGSCAVTCPACPHPGKNLPDGWENAPPESRFLYALFLVIDANFRLARRNVSSDAVDPGLNHGYSFFVKETKSTCSSHNAINLADTKASRGLAATGAGTIDCAQHNFKRPNSVAFRLSVLYLLLTYSQTASMLQVINISYDIACQWSKNLWTHMSAFPQQYHLDHDTKTITFLGVGRTDGEALERGWANINPIATSTREMGPGSRRDTLNDHFNGWNWKKVCLMGKILARKLKAALLEVLERRCDLNNFEAALNSSQLACWKEDIVAWEADHSKPNPFELKVTAVSQASVRLASSKAEADDIEHGTSMSLHDDISPSMLILSGLDLEDQQRCLAFEARKIGQHPTNAQQVTLLQHINSLRRCIDTWSHVQLLYMLCVSRLRSSDDIATKQKVHKIILFLPSAIPSNLPCEERLLNHEWDLHEAQANNALNNICCVLNMKYHLYKYKDTFIRGQRANTRTTGVINNADNLIDALAAKYNAVHNALVKLAPRLHKDDNWLLTFKPLNCAKDAVLLRQDNGATVSQQTVSWIWKTHGVSDNTEYGLQDSHRWEEAVQPVCEEMRCVLAFFEWQAVWWDMQGSRRTFGSPEIAEGAVAYAHWQASLQRSLAFHFRSIWGAIPSS
ncbi:uncharacterized protein EDB91DRAFT_1240183 [Suillus paluster]|uniref:uncharacterized protein n=1 Tax=Suillus paluster TaxID=48578 RepID=UPI001B875A3C|nr:uncharacterized protein EDB91DRAFT_1240183 [Suillus paluster]KAG1722798.1 hypothetical protein EDB91DRAFT_1240183 [Suillus paluster]